MDISFFDLTNFILSLTGLISSVFLHIKHSQCNNGGCICDVENNQNDQDN